MKKNFDSPYETLGGTYREENGHLIPNVNEMLEVIISQLATERGIDENLKARDMLRWVAEMNNIKASAEETVLREVVLV